MSLNKYLSALAVTAFAFGAGAASAATYNFEVSGANERGVADGASYDETGDPYDGAGVNLVFVAGFDFDGTKAIKSGKSAYFDGPSGPPGGLGVCGTLDGNDQCDPGSDDNITVGEALGINFGTGTLTSITFRGTELGGTGSHNLLANGTFLWSTDGVNFQQGSTDGSGVWATNLNLTNGTGIFFAVDDYELYVSAAEYRGGPPDGGPEPVPLPAGGLLLLTALGGLGVARKRAKKS